MNRLIDFDTIDEIYEEDQFDNKIVDGIGERGEGI
jgi:hypothetical protein